MVQGVGDILCLRSRYASLQRRGKHASVCKLFRLSCLHSYIRPVEKGLGGGPFFYSLLGRLPGKLGPHAIGSLEPKFL